MKFSHHHHKPDPDSPGVHFNNRGVTKEGKVKVKNAAWKVLHAEVRKSLKYWTPMPSSFSPEKTTIGSMNSKSHSPKIISCFLALCDVSCQ